MSVRLHESNVQTSLTGAALQPEGKSAPSSRNWARERCTVSQREVTGRSRRNRGTQGLATVYPALGPTMRSKKVCLNARLHVCNFTVMGPHDLRDNQAATEKKKRKRKKSPRSQTLTTNDQNCVLSGKLKGPWQDIGGFGGLYVGCDWRGRGGARGCCRTEGKVQIEKSYEISSTKLRRLNS